MTSLARIPFTAEDESVINTLNGWMLFLAIIHFLGAAFFLLCGCLAFAGSFATFAVNVFGGVAYMLQMFTVPILGAIMLVEGVFALQARSSLAAVVNTDQGDQQHLSAAFKRLKLFFMLELVWFAVSVISSFLGVVVAIVAPELAGRGFQMDQSGFGGAS